MINKIKFHDEAKVALQEGINLLAEAVKITLGPRGRNVIISSPASKIPTITKDGVTVAEIIEVEDGIINTGIEVIKQAASNTENMVGDGTTTATVLTQALINEGLGTIEESDNPILIKKGMDLALKHVLEYLDKITVKINGNEDAIMNVATISANNSKEIGAIISEVITTINKDGIATIEASTNNETTVTNSKGIDFNRGYLSSMMVTDTKKMEVRYTNPLILCFNKKLTDLSDVTPAITHAVASKRPLVIIADEVNNYPIKQLEYSTQVNNTDYEIAIVQAPEFGDHRKEILEDIAIATGGKMVGVESGSLKTLSILETLGESEAILINKYKTIITGLNHEKDGEAIANRVKEIKTLIDQNIKSKVSSDFKHSIYESRIAKLTGGIATIHVGGKSEMEISERKDRIQDALNATKAALEEGVVPGGGIALLRALKSLDLKISKLDAIAETEDNELIGYNIVREALFSPFNTILDNAGVDKEIVYDTVCEYTSNRGGNPFIGYDVLSNKYGDLMEMGIIDPVKVTKSCISTAVSIASIFLTTECIINLK